MEQLDDKSFAVRDDGAVFIPLKGNPGMGVVITADELKLMYLKSQEMISKYSKKNPC